MEFIRGICTFCGTGCGHFLRIKDNEVIGVFPAQNHPVSKGRLCVRGWNIHELLASPRRITTPLVRKNGVLEKATYDEALAAAAEQLQKHISDKGDAVAFLGSPRASNEESYLFMKLARTACKTNNISLEAEAGQRASMNVLGDGVGLPAMTASVDDIRKTSLILVVGFDITKQNPIVGSEIHLAAQGGAHLVTIDSRTTQIARLSKDFLHVKPGSTKIMLAALAKAMIEENLLNTAFIQKHTEGFEGFANSLGSLTYEDAAQKTGIDAEEIKRIARLIAAAPSAMVFYPSGISGFDEETVKYVLNLFLVAGQIGKPGTGVCPITGLNNLQGNFDMGTAPDLLTGFQKLADKGAVEKFNKEWKVQINAAAGKSAKELLGDAKSSFKALVVMDHDDGIIRNAERLKKLDTVVYIGAFENAFTEFATVVLPIASYVETDGTYTNAERRIQLSQRKVEGKAGVIPGWQVIVKLAEKMGQKWNYAAAADVFTEIARVTPSYSKATYAKLQNIKGIQWPCDDKNPEGTERLKIAESGGHLKFQKVGGSFQAPKADAGYPFLLMTGKAQHYWHMNNLMKKTQVPLREFNATLLLFPEGYVEICAADAKEIGVREKWPVKIVSPAGSMKVEVHISEDVTSKTAYVPYFVQEMISQFLLEHTEPSLMGEDATIPVRIEKV